MSSYYEHTAQTVRSGFRPWQRARDVMTGPDDESRGRGVDGEDTGGEGGEEGGDWMQVEDMHIFRGKIVPDNENGS
jgi:hypothetical protein